MRREVGRAVCVGAALMGVGGCLSTAVPKLQEIQLTPTPPSSPLEFDEAQQFFLDQQTHRIFASILENTTQSFPDINQRLNQGDLAIKTLINPQNPNSSPFYVEQRDGEKVEVGLSLIVDNKGQTVAVVVNTGEGWQVAPLQLASMFNNRGELIGYNIVAFGSEGGLIFEILDAYRADGTLNPITKIPVSYTHLTLPTIYSV